MRLHRLATPGRLSARRRHRRLQRSTARPRCPERAPARSSRPRTSGTGPSTDLPVAADSAAMISAIGLDAPVHPDFGSFLGYGIPYNVVSSKKVHKVHVTFDYADESDKVAYPMPAHPRQEGGGDAHVLIVDKTACRLYELYAAHESGGTLEGRLGRGLEPALEPPASGLAGRAPTPPASPSCPASCATTRSPRASSGTRSASRPRARARRTSTRPGTTPAIPTRSLPPMGLRVRLKASVDISGYGKQARVVAAGAQDVRDDPRRQRQPLVHLGRQQQALRRRRCCTRSARSPVRTSRSSTPRTCATADPREG